jgi:ribulose 1,5-bisphosphate carboxylase large subunit-like protein
MECVKPVKQSNVMVNYVISTLRLITELLDDNKTNILLHLHPAPLWSC